MALVPREDGRLSFPSLLDFYRRRMRLDTIARYVGVAAGCSSLLWLIYAGSLLLGYPAPHLFLAASLYTVAALLSAPLVGLLRAPGAHKTAQMLDLLLDNRQRVVTSLGLTSANERGVVGEAQVADTTRLLASADPDLLYPVRLPLAPLALLAALFALAVGIFLLKDPGVGIAAQAGELPTGALTPSALFSPTPQPGLPGAQAQQSPAPTGGDSLKLGMSPEEAARKAEASRKAQDALDRLKQALDEQSATQGAADSLRKGDYGKAGDQLSELGQQNDQLSESAKKGMADALNKAAGDPSTTPSLSDAERKAADALQRGNYGDTASGLKELGAEVQKTAGAVVPQQDLAKGFPQDPTAGQSQGQGSPQDESAQGSKDPASGQSSDVQSGDQGSNSSAGQGQNSSGAGQPKSGQGAGGGNNSSREEGQGQSGGSGKSSSKVSGPSNPTTSNAPGNPFELEGKGTTGQTNPGQPGDKPGMTLQGNGAGAGQTLPPSRGSAGNVPGESNNLPVERWGVIQRYFSHEK